MGSALIKGQRGPGNDFPPLLFETQIFATWTLADVKKLYKCFQSQVYGFAVVEIQFESIMSFMKDEITEHVSMEDLFRILDNDHDGRIDGLELLGGLLLCCNATFEEKARFCFEMFDFNLNSMLSENDTAMMMVSCICGMNALTGGEDIDPDIETIERIVKDAFLKADSNLDGLLSFDEFVHWARSNRDLMAGLEKLNKVALDAKNNIDTDDSAEEVDENYLIDDISSPNQANKVANTIKLHSTDWKSQVLEPTNFRMSRAHLNGPRTNLALNWAFGYRGDCRNNIRYLGESYDQAPTYIVYPTATLAVIYDIKSKSQSFYQGHSSEITSVSIHPNGSIVATSDISSNIHIWNSSTKSCMIVINGIVKEGIQQIAISPSGSHIVSVGMDNDHTIAIFSTSTGELISSAKGISSCVNDMCFSNNGTELALVGDRGQLKIMTGIHTTKRLIDSYMAKVGKIGKKHTFLSVAYVHDYPIVGCASGEIYRFKAGRCVEVVQAYAVNEPVFTIFYNKEEDTFTTGGKDGTIKTWDHSLKEIGVPIDLSDLTRNLHSTIVAKTGFEIISVQHIGNRIVTGTKGGDIYDIDIYALLSGETGIVKVASGHSSGELWGLAVHPSKDEFVTCGDDKSIRIWSIRSHEIIRSRTMPCSARAVSYNSAGDIIIVGMEDGNIALMEANSPILKVYSTWKHSSNASTCLRASPDGKYLAVGCSDGNIFIYKTDDSRNYSKLAVAKAHTESIIALDFSYNSQYLHSNACDQSIYFWDNNGNQVKETSLLRDVTWATLSCPMSWGTQGMFQKENKSIVSCSCIADLHDAVGGYSDGSVCLYYYPSLSSDSLYQRYIGHAGPISSVRFSYNRRHVVSIGSKDRTILLWKHDIELEQDSGDEFGGSSSSGSDVDGYISSTEVPSSIYIVDGVKEKQNNLTSLSIEKKPNKQWHSSIIEPSLSAPGHLSQSTDIDFNLTWVHGIRSFDCRNNVYYSSSGSVVYHSGCVAISYNKGSGKQKFLQGFHKSDILSIACHPSGQLFATGDIGAIPNIVVWDAISMTTTNVILSNHKLGVSLLAFTKKGQYLASIGQDENSSLIVYDWAKQVEILCAPVSKQKVLSLTCMQYDKAIFSVPGASESKSVAGADQREFSKSSLPISHIMVPDEDVIITGGKKFLKFQWCQGQNIISQNAIWGSEKKDVIMALASASPNICLSGSIKGTLMLWKNFSVENNLSTNTQVGEIYPHKSPILSIHGIPGKVLSCPIDVKRNVFEDRIRGSYQEYARYLVGDQAGVISLWVTVENSLNFKVDLICIKIINVQTLSPKSLNPSVRSIVEKDGVLLLSTKAGEIYEILESSCPFLYDTEMFINSRTISKPALGSETQISSQRLVSCHHTAEVWGLTVHPSLPIFFTSGDDCTIRCWSLTENELLSYVVLPEKARAICINPVDTVSFAVGFHTGDIWIMPLSNLMNPNKLFGVTIDNSLPGEEVPLVTHDSIKVLPRGPTQWIMELKYSFDGKFLAAAAHDNNLYIYTLQEKISILSVCKGHSGPVNHFDFGVMLSVRDVEMNTADLSNESLPTINMTIETIEEKSNKILTIKRSQLNSSNGVVIEETTDRIRDIGINDIVIQSTSESGELFYWKLNGSRITSPGAVKDAWWSSWTIPFGWPTQGFHPEIEDGKLISVTSVARSYSWKQVPAIAATDSLGRIRLFNYPCVSLGAPDKCYLGHSNNITNIKFSFNDAYCITIGGNDKAIFVWETDILDEIRERKAVASLTSPSPVLTITSSSKTSEIGSVIKPCQETEGSELACLLPIKFSARRGDEFTAIKPWKGAIREPSNWVDSNDCMLMPNESLVLSHVYGYRGWDCRNNLCFADSRSRIVYHAAAIGIVHNTESNTQIFNIDHDDDIISLAIHPAGHTVATGEIGKVPKIVIWDVNTGATIKIIKFHSRGVGTLTFSYDGSMLISTGLDDDRIVAVHSVKSGALISKGKVGKGVDLYGISVSLDTFCTVGKNHIKFWTLPNATAPSGSELSSKTGIFNNKAINARTATSVSYLGRDAITGMLDGMIVQWKDRSSSKFKAAHKGAVTAICSVVPPTSKGALDSSETGSRVITGGRDGFVHIWNVQLELLWSLDMNKTTPLSSNPSIQSLSYRENRLILGTKASEIYEVNILNDQEVHRLVVGHFGDRSEVCGLASHPSFQRFVTAGDDMTVRLWDRKARAQIGIHQFGSKAKTVAFSPDGNEIGVGTADGRVIILSCDLSEVLSDASLTSADIRVIQYSTDSAFLAVGCSDGSIILMETSSHSIYTKCSGHHGSITGIDWSADSKVFQSCSADYEILYWEASSGVQIKTPSMIRDMKWATSNCVIGWAVQGVWSTGANGSGVNSVDKSPCGKLLVSGDDTKHVKLFRYPCPKENSNFKSYKGHSEFVTNVRFSHDGKCVFSVGGLDKTVLQYEVKYNTK